MGQVFSVERRVEFRDTDMAGIVHFSVFLVYMEQTEHAFLRSLDLGVMMEIEGRSIGFPRVNVQCDYRCPLQFEQMVRIDLQVLRLGEKSVTYGFHFTRDGRAIADGSITAACVELDPIAAGPVAVPIPTAFSDRLRPFLSDDV